MLSNRFGVLMTAAGLALAAPSLATEDASLPAHAVILFGANWCAPCLEELRNLPALSAAAAPGPLLVAWTDGEPRKLWREWPANARLMPIGEAGSLMQRTGGSTAGLPYAILLDGKGKLCADLRGKLTAERLAALRQRCAAAS